eukprot:TRINITY_DN22415_c1_g1_i1.p1 TRINITY_DN22415_c1_g1~~TRINITY_DN22415_c1_g1_i1.p1  ORF type:complete len:212 (-),score=-1.78 TRINITY_DN22415_c1_g1_i1:17-652(-)
MWGWFLCDIIDGGLFQEGINYQSQQRLLFQKLLNMVILFAEIFFCSASQCNCQEGNFWGLIFIPDWSALEIVWVISTPECFSRVDFFIAVFVFYKFLWHIFIFEGFLSLQQWLQKNTFSFKAEIVIMFKNYDFVLIKNSKDLCPGIFSDTKCSIKTVFQIITENRNLLKSSAVQIARKFQFEIFLIFQKSITQPHQKFSGFPSISGWNEYI